MTENVSTTVSDRPQAPMRDNGRAAWRYQVNIQHLLQQGTQALICVSPVELEEFALYLLQRQAEQKADSDRLYTRKEFAERHRVSLATLWRWEKQGIIQPTRYGSKVYYRDCDLIEH